VAGTAGFAYVAPGYTHEEPLRRVAERFRTAMARRPGTGSTEPGIDLAEGALGLTAAGFGADGFGSTAATATSIRLSIELTQPGRPLTPLPR
jgi:hypothetical protein